MKSAFLAMLGMICLVLSACGDETPPTAAEPQPTDPREQQARKAQALDAVGYDGAAVENQLKQQIHTSDAQQQQRDDARRAAGGQ